MACHALQHLGMADHAPIAVMKNENATGVIILPPRLRCGLMFKAFGAVEFQAWLGTGENVVAQRQGACPNHRRKVAALFRLKDRMLWSNLSFIQDRVAV